MIKLKDLLENVTYTDEVVVHHGTPHKVVGNFNIEKIGSGEGSAAYGWGFYFAENLGVAKSYVKPNITIYGKSIGDYIDEQDFSDSLEDYARKNGYSLDDEDDREYAEEEWNREEMFKIILDYLNEYGYDAKNEMWNHESRETLNMFAELENSRVIKTTPGNLYTIEINASEDQLLNWFELIGNHSEYVKNVILGIPKNVIAISNEDILINSGQKIYNILRDVLKSKKNASLYLKNLGIQGIKFLDRFSRVGKGQTYNYVIFDPALIHIKNENGIPISPEQASQDNLNLKAV